MEEFVYTGRGQMLQEPEDVVSVRFDSSVTEVGDETFYDCYRLNNVVMNDGLTKIGKLAFAGCISLESITIPSTLTEIDHSAFENCGSLTEVRLHEGLQTIGDSVFEGCPSLQSISIPSTVTEIGMCAFMGCGLLREVELHEGLQTIGIDAFLDCPLESITLPSTLRELGDEAFMGCSRLREVRLHEGLKKIGDSTFAHCISLQSISIPSTLIEIGKEAFVNCSSLREVVLHEEIQTIGQGAFGGCHSLERFTFPSISTRLNNVIEVETNLGRTRQLNEINVPRLIELLDEINTIRGDMIVTRGRDLFVPGAVLRGGNSWNTIKASLDQIVSWIRYHEIKEETTLFELALWKAKLDQSDEATDINREAYRVEVPGPVKEAILQFL